MTNTEQALIDTLGSVTVPLVDVCEDYFGLAPRAAMAAAALNKLPVPTFRLRESQKSPLMVHVRDLAEHIENMRDRATEHWERSQV